LINGDSPWEQAAAYCVHRGISPTTLKAYNGYNLDQRNRLGTIFTKIQPAWVAWKAKYGSNAPLRRYRTGNRDWDFNTDGMAHYGLMPDFLQDLKNIGMSSSNLTPLMRSAEDYLRMWEKAIKASKPTGQPGIQPEGFCSELMDLPWDRGRPRPHPGVVAHKNCAAQSSLMLMFRN